MTRIGGQGLHLSLGQIVPTRRGVPIGEEVVFTLPVLTDRARFWNFSLPYTNPQEIFHFDDSRITLGLTNTGAVGAIIYLGIDPGEVAADRGYPLGGGLSVTIDGYVGTLWARATVATTRLGLIALFLPR